MRQLIISLLILLIGTFPCPSRASVFFSADGEDYTRTAGGLPSTTIFTYCAWVRVTTDQNDWSGFVAYDNGTTPTVYKFFGTNSDGVTLSAAVDGGSDPEIASNALTVGVWNFVCLTKAGNGAGLSNIYSRAFNANSLTTANGTLASAGTITTMRVGESGFGGEFLIGDIAAVKIWDGVALSAAEVLNESYSFMPRRFEGLHEWHPFLVGEAAGGAQTDYSGNGRTLTGGTNSETSANPPISWR